MTRALTHGRNTGMRCYEMPPGGDVPALVDRPVPAPGPGQVVLKIAACGLNFADLLMIDGSYQDRPEPPFVLGLEAAGHVVEVGAGVTAIRPGQRVAAFGGQGGLAEYGCFAAERCLAIPDAMPFVHAAGFQIAYGTAHVALSHRARLAPGETLVVFGAAGGVGLTAVEVGKLLGARVIGVARGAEKSAVVRAAGVDHVVDAAAGDLRGALRDLGGADVVYDPVGGAAFADALRATNPDGRLLTIGFASGTVPQIAANHLLVKNLSVIGLYWGGYLAFRPDLLRASLDVLVGWYRAGRLRPHIGATIPLDRVAEGLDLLRRRRAAGKIVVTMPAG